MKSTIDHPPHILFVLENYYPNIGGVETLFKGLVETLSQQGHQITIITTLLSPSHPKKETIGKLQILRYRFINRYLFTLLAIFPILKHGRNADLIHTTSYNAALPSFIAAKLLRKKVIVTFHEVWASLWFQLPYMSAFGKKLHWLFEQMLIRLPFDRFIGVSKSTAQNLIKAGVAAERVHYIYNGIDYADFRTEGAVNLPSSFTYTFFGRLGVSKGLDLLLGAAVLFYKKNPSSRLRLILPKDPDGFLKLVQEEIGSKGLDTHIELLHELPFSELKRKLKESHAVVIPSYSEGFCFAAVECTALDVPIISSDQMALKETVSGKHIKMAEQNAEALFRALEKARAGEWVEIPVRHFYLKDTIANYIKLYGQLLNDNSSYARN